MTLHRVAVITDDPLDALTIARALQHYAGCETNGIRHHVPPQLVEEFRTLAASGLSTKVRSNGPAVEQISDPGRGLTTEQVRLLLGLTSGRHVADIAERAGITKFSRGRWPAADFEALAQGRTG